MLDLHNWILAHTPSRIIRVIYFTLVIVFFFLLCLTLSPIVFIFEFIEENKGYVEESYITIWNWNKEKQKSHQQLIQKVENDNIKEL